LFLAPHEPLAPLWIARLCRVKYCNCNCMAPCHWGDSSPKLWRQMQTMLTPDPSTRNSGTMEASRFASAAILVFLFLRTCRETHRGDRSSGLRMRDFGPALGHCLLCLSPRHACMPAQLFPAWGRLKGFNGCSACKYKCSCVFILSRVNVLSGYQWPARHALSVLYQRLL
jgi:hypothetical protein